MPRSFLMLQGTASPFFARLGSALQDRGDTVRKVNFCGGDVLYNGGHDAWNYRGALGDLPDWYEEIICSGKFSDVLMFGDCRVVHHSVHSIAQRVGVPVYVFEEGYVRPNWLTLERHGVNGRSLLARDPNWYLARRAVVPASPPAKATGYSLAERAFHDIRYRAANALYAARFPHYRSHRPRNGLVEYSGLLVRTLNQRWYMREADRATRELVSLGRPYYLLPLQLSSDAQIVVHSPYESVCDVIDQVVRSFVRFGPSDSCLVIKNHPLDTGLVSYRRYTTRLARSFGIEGRIKFIDAGHLPTLLENARGVVVVNSTVGLSALHHGCPLIALGDAIYSMAGLTWQGGLDYFWRDAPAPNMELYRAFLDYVIHHTQINGDFYTRTGIEMAVRGAVDRLDRADA